MKVILLFLLLNTSIRSIDTGCSVDKPALCSVKHKTNEKTCKDKYENCDGFEGCTNPEYPYLCSNGECAVNFANCSEKYYNCEKIKYFNKRSEVC